MMQLTSLVGRKTESVADYFRAILEDRPELIHGQSDQELLSRWLQDHPDQTGVPDNIKTTLAKVRKLLRKDGADRQEPEVQSMSALMECAPPEASPAEPKDIRRSDTVHDRSGESVVEKVVQAKLERRSEARHQLHQALIAVPVLPDGSPDWEHRVGGMCVDLSRKGMGLQLHTRADFPTTSLVLLLSDPTGDICSTAMEVRYTQPDGEDRIRVGGSFGGFAEEILPVDNVTPTFNPHTMKFSQGVSDQVLHKWAEIGVLRQMLRDRVQLCPKCHSLPTFRPACPSCGSADTTNDQLIHHFACAYVGLVSDFESDGELVCPKCRTRHLVVASDYEYCTGPYRCGDCHWSDTKLEQVAQCLRCEFRFPAHQAYEQELTGYRARRLDPVALIIASGAVPSPARPLAPQEFSPRSAPHDDPVPTGRRA